SREEEGGSGGLGGGRFVGGPAMSTAFIAGLNLFLVCGCCYCCWCCVMDRCGRCGLVYHNGNISLHASFVACRNHSIDGNHHDHHRSSHSHHHHFLHLHAHAHISFLPCC